MAPQVVYFFSQSATYSRRMDNSSVDKGEGVQLDIANICDLLHYMLYRFFSLTPIVRRD